MIGLRKQVQDDVFSVTDLVRRLTQVIEEEKDFARVWVQGEISNFKHHARGHMYFTLKDDRTRIRAVMFAGHNRRLRFSPRDGDDVLIRGRMGVYERDGQVQLYVTHMQPNGVGELFVAYERLKEELEQEGLFAPEHKKALPFLPGRVGLITSAHGAAVRDMITTLRRRSRMVDILVCPVAVQGVDAPRQIVDALNRLNRTRDVDVIIVGRGGGSLEELWAFNEEAVARGIYESQIPVVSAVGHETDTTISDFVADVRAATPTAAAEIVAPRFEELQSQLSGMKKRLTTAVEQRVQSERERLSRVMDRPVFRRAEARLEPFEQRLDDLTRDLLAAVRQRFSPLRSRLEAQKHRLRGQHPSARLHLLSQQLTRISRQCRLGMDRQLQDKRAEWLRRMEYLDALSPLKVMHRGYSLVYRYGDRRLLKSVKDVQAGDLIRVRMSDGRLKCQVWGWEDDPDGSG
ncbi:MAG: exodeoxyribonuclease VII large subunit [Firmicutes bacterium]|nr:exodeoxyribonuclease VII large subunit [Bacillota bacterium]